MLSPLVHIYSIMFCHLLAELPDRLSSKTAAQEGATATTESQGEGMVQPSLCRHGFCVHVKCGKCDVIDHNSLVM